MFNDNPISKITTGNNVEFSGNVYTEINPESDERHQILVNSTFGGYGDEFKRDYEKNNKAAGVYIYDNDTKTWIFEK